MQEKFIHEERSIKFSVLRKLPAMAIVSALVKTEDAEGKEVEAMLVTWRDGSGRRKAYFSLETGEYIADKFPMSDGTFV